MESACKWKVMKNVLGFFSLKEINPVIFEKKDLTSLS